MHEFVRVDPNSFVYDLISLLNIHNKMARFKIQDDINSQYVLKVENEDSQVYVDVEHHLQ